MVADVDWRLNSILGHEHYLDEYLFQLAELVVVDFFESIVLECCYSRQIDINLRWETIGSQAVFF